MSEDEKKMNGLEWALQNLQWDYSICKSDLKAYKIGFWVLLTINLIGLVGLIAFGVRVWP